MAAASDPTAKRRCPNFTEEELSVTIQELVKRKELLLGRFEGDGGTARKTAHAWEEVASPINTVSRVMRDATQVRRKFTDFGQLSRRQQRRSKEQRKTCKPEWCACQEINILPLTIYIYCCSCFMCLTSGTRE